MSKQMENSTFDSLCNNFTYHLAHIIYFIERHNLDMTEINNLKAEIEQIKQAPANGRG